MAPPPATNEDAIENPVTGERIVWRQRARDTGGELLVADLHLKPDAFVAAEHVHPRQEERFEVLQGQIRAQVAGVERTFSAGESFVVAPGIRHRWWNAAKGETVVRIELRPALRTEAFFEGFFRLAREGKTDPKTGLPGLLQLAVSARAFSDEIRLARPPYFVQVIVLGALAAIGRALGYRAG